MAKKPLGNVIIKPGSSVVMPKVFSTGMARLDYDILRIGGLPLGRIVELAGKFSAGKSSLAMNIVKAAQQQDLSCCWVDLEGDSYTAEWAKGIGVDVDKLALLDTCNLSGTDICNRLASLVALYNYNVIVLDSLANIRSNLQVNTPIGMEKMDTDQSRAKLLTRFFQALHGGWKMTSNGEMAEGKNELAAKDGRTIYKLNEFPVTLIYINHLKDKFSSKKKSQFGYVREDSIGGEAGKFSACIRLFLSKKASQQDDPADCSRIKIHCEKHKLAPPYKNGDFLFNRETCVFEEDYKFLLDNAVEKGIITGGGGGHYVIGEEKFRGVKEFKARCIKDAEFYKQMAEALG